MQVGAKTREMRNPEGGEKERERERWGTERREREREGERERWRDGWNSGKERERSA